MVKVECDGCKSPYQVDERRIPNAGLKMRCQKCGTTFVVTKPGAPAADVVDLPAAPAAKPPPPRPGAPPRPPPPPVPRAAVRKPAPPAPPPRPAPAETVQLGADDYDADLPAPTLSDLPAARSVSSKPFGEIDLAVDLPAPARTMPPTAALLREAASMMLEADDLPVVHGHSARPGPTRSEGGGFGEIDLPIIHGAGAEPGLPARIAPDRGSFGEIDLPSVTDDLPAAFGELPEVRGSPAPFRAGSGGAFGEIDLPMASDVSLPEVAATGLPSTVTGSALPSLAAGLPGSATGTGMPQIAGAALPKTAQVHPPVVKAGGVGTIVGAELFGDDDMSHPAEGLDKPRGLPLPPPGSHEDLSYEFGDEIPLDETPLPPRAPAPPAASMAPIGGMASAAGGVDIGAIDPGPTGDVGGEVELDALGESSEVAQQAPRSRRDIASPGSVALAPKRSRLPRILLASAVVLALGGGALALVPGVGAFGYLVVSDKINASANRASLESLRNKVQANLDTDTAAAAGKALGDARAAHDAAPRYRPVSGYAAYVAFARGLRFGRRAEDETYAKQILTAAGAADEDTLLLGNAAADAATAQLARARQTVAALAQRAPADADVAALAGEIELVAKDGGSATVAWKRAVGVKKTARTLFGLARAAFIAGDLPAAEASAQEALKLSPKHVGARILIGSIAAPTSSREQEAIGLLTKVTEDAEVRAMASDAELVEAYTVLGRVHLGHSRMSAAEQAFKAATDLNPQALQALLGNGELFYRAGRYSEAQARFEAAMQADSDSVIAKVGKAKSMLALESMKPAKDLLKKLKTDKPKDSLVAYWLGRAEEALSNKPEAEAAYADAIKLGDRNPEVVDAYVALSRLLASEGRTEDAAAKLAEAVKTFPDSAALDKARGEVALQTGRIEDAKGNFTHALEKQDDLGTRFDLGIAERRLRNFDESGKIFDQVAAIDKEFPGLALERGLLFEQTGQSERALEMYNDALRKAPDDLDLKLRVASTQVIAGHAKQAIPMLKEIQAKRNLSAEASHFLGRAELVSGSNLAEAMRNLERATEIDPNHAEYWLYVGWAANEIGQPGKAEAALKRALELDRDLGDAYWQRGVLLQKQGQSIDALADLKTALEKSPSRYEAYATMALCYQDQSNWPEAENAWRRAIAANDGFTEWHYRLGKILYAHGNRVGTAQELDKSATLAEALDTKPAWLFDVYHLLGDCVLGVDREKAKHSYTRYLELAPSDDIYRSEIQKKLEGLGVHPPR